MPPIANAPRRWQVATSSSVYALIIGAVMVTDARSGSTKAVTGVAEVLDDAEQVVPPAGVEPGGVIAQLVQDLVHLERRGDRLDQHRRPHRAVRDAEPLLGEGEDVVPQPRLEVALGLGEVEVRAAAAAQQFGGVVEEVEAEVDERGHGRLTVDQQVLLVEVPAARADHDDREPAVVAARTPCLRGW